MALFLFSDVDVVFFTSDSVSLIHPCVWRHCYYRLCGSGSLPAHSPGCHSCTPRLNLRPLVRHQAFSCFFSAPCFLITHPIWFFVLSNYWLRSLPSPSVPSQSPPSCAILPNFLHSLSSSLFFLSFCLLYCVLCLARFLMLDSGWYTPAHIYCWVINTTNISFKSIITFTGSIGSPFHASPPPQSLCESRCPILSFHQRLNELATIRHLLITS